METRMFKRSDGVRARVKTVGFLAHEVDVWDRTGYVFTELESGCEPRAAAAQAIAEYDETRGLQRPGQLAPTDFPLIEQVIAALG